MFDSSSKFLTLRFMPSFLNRIFKREKMMLNLFFQTQNNMYELVTDLHGNQMCMEQRVNRIEDKLIVLQVRHGEECSF